MQIKRSAFFNHSIPHLVPKLFVIKALKTSAPVLPRCARVYSGEPYSSAVTAPQLSTESREDVLRALVAYARQQKLTAEY